MSAVAALLPPSSFFLVDKLLSGQRLKMKDVTRAHDLMPCFMQNVPRPFCEPLKMVIEDIRKCVAQNYCHNKMQVHISDPRLGTNELVCAQVISSDDSCATFAEDGSWAPNKGIFREVPFYRGAVCC